jgi:hypothetical protein
VNISSSNGWLRRFLIIARTPRLWRVGALLLLASLGGCALIPRTLHEPRYHNPFPQLHRVAVLPFFNQTDNPFVDPELVAQQYAHELQSIPGFEVAPVEFVKSVMAQAGIRGQSRQEFRTLAKLMQVDAVVVGSVTEFDPYYPPRLGLAVDWYAANEGFHAIPPGYGLPWGTADEEYIPDAIVEEAEFALARAQLETQTPACDTASPAAGTPRQRNRKPDGTAPAEELPPPASKDGTEDITTVAAVAEASEPAASAISTDAAVEIGSQPSVSHAAGGLPPDWPDPSGFIPDAPQATRPPCRPQTGPVMTHVRVYDAANGDFTAALQHWHEFRVDGRGGDWRGVLQRSDDFIRFCCYQHITSMLASRGGAGKTRVVRRWSLDRYGE